MGAQRTRPSHKSEYLPHDALREPFGLLVVGGAVAAELVIAKTDEVAVVVRHISAYPEGFSFLLVIRLRQPDPDLYEATETLRFNPGRGNRRVPENVYLRLELADGRSLTPPFAGQRADEPALWPLGGCTTAAGYWGEFAAPVLPSDGAVALVCDWSRRGIEGARAMLAASQLTEAAVRAQPLWEVADVAVAGHRPS
jgi:hypothetical protein